MEKNRRSCSILLGLNLNDIEEVVNEAYHKEGPGRPPRKPIGIFKALIVKRIKHIPSDRELYRRLWQDEDLREVCDIEENEKPYHPSQLTRFRNRVGVERLEKMLQLLLDELRKKKVVTGKKVVLDATFVKAYSRRDPKDDKRGLSDPEARVGRDGKTYGLGYKLHLAIDAKSELPLAVIVASANDNQKKPASSLFKKALNETNGRTKFLVADSQFSSKTFRDGLCDFNVKAVIPYPSNQMRGKKGVLRVDRKFRTHGPSNEKRLYRARSSIERVNSRLEEQVCVGNHRVRRLNRIWFHALLCLIAMLLNAVAAVRLGMRDKVRSMSLLAE